MSDGPTALDLEGILHMGLFEGHNLQGSVLLARVLAEDDFDFGKLRTLTSSIVTTGLCKQESIGTIILLLKSTFGTNCIPSVPMTLFLE